MNLDELRRKCHGWVDQVIGSATAGVAHQVVDSVMDTVEHYAAGRQDDLSGECRVDPSHGNAFVLRKVEHRTDYGYVVVINDVLGGHTMTLPLNTWLSWEIGP